MMVGGTLSLAGMGALDARRGPPTVPRAGMSASSTIHEARKVSRDQELVCCLVPVLSVPLSLLLKVTLWSIASFTLRSGAL